LKGQARSRKGWKKERVISFTTNEFLGPPKEMKASLMQFAGFAKEFWKSFGGDKKRGRE